MAAMAGALTLEALFTLFNLLGVAERTWQPTVQGVIIIAAVAYAAGAPRSRLPSPRTGNRRSSESPRRPHGGPS